MKHVVVTGGTRGLGLGLAHAFLSLGCRVTLTGRTQQGVDAALAQLGSEAGSVSGTAQRVHGVVCDVREQDDLRALWLTAAGHAPIDVWINNAGRNTAPRPFWELDVATARAIVDTNLVGTILGSWVAMRGMLEQGHGALYNVEGLGSDGSRWPGLSVYGASKLGVGYLSKALAAEARGRGVVVGTLEPGIVITPMLAEVFAEPARFGLFARFIEGLAQPVEVVAPALARKVLANTHNGVRLRPASAVALWTRVLLAPLRARRLVLPQP